ncbi:MAG TPA: hypothetical protein VJN70_00020 [Gemmatimonadaceae bacterium]|nr:hypothetical protein [Gemmatimonadaceae bacterium]
MFRSTRVLSRVCAFGFMVLVGANAPTDSTRHVYGYGGIVPVPPAVDEGQPTQTPDILTQRRIAVRSKNGRVLYANERVTMPAASDDHAAASRSRHPCSQLVQRTAATAAPNS